MRSGAGTQPELLSDVQADAIIHQAYGEHRMAGAPRFSRQSEPFDIIPVSAESQRIVLRSTASSSRRVMSEFVHWPSCSGTSFIDPFHLGRCGSLRLRPRWCRSRRGVSGDDAHGPLHHLDPHLLDIGSFPNLAAMSQSVVEDSALAVVSGPDHREVLILAMHALVGTGRSCWHRGASIHGRDLARNP